MHKGNGVYITGVDVPIPTPIWAENRRAGIDSSTETENSTELDSAVDVLWNDSAPYREPLPIPRMVPSEELEGRVSIRSVANPLSIRDSKRSKRQSVFALRSKEKGTVEEPPIPTDNNPGVVRYVSEGLKRRNKNSSTIFQNSPLAPITIIVTTPEDDIPSPPSTPAPEPRNSFNLIRANRNSSTISLPATQFSRCFSTDSLPLPQPKQLDPNRLMPPMEHQIDGRRLRKTQEFREIRKFLVHFMNAKGDQFPKKLRSRMMEAYAITDSDLSPEVVARFNDIGDIKDEGVALEQLSMNELDKETTDAEDLRILSMAFQSQIPVVTPSREAMGVDTISAYNKNRPHQTSISKPAPQMPAKFVKQGPPSPPLNSSKPMKPAEEDEPLNWLGPLISISSTTDWSLPLQDDDRSRLQKAHSVPNMHRRPPNSDAPPVPSLSNSNSSMMSGLGRGRNNSVTGGGSRGVSVEKTMHIAKLKRQGIISGAFGAVREAMGGKKVGVGGERRRLMREGR